MNSALILLLITVIKWKPLEQEQIQLRLGKSVQIISV